MRKGHEKGRQEKGDDENRAKEPSVRAPCDRVVCGRAVCERVVCKKLGTLNPYTDIQHQKCKLKRSLVSNILLRFLSVILLRSVLVSLV